MISGSQHGSTRLVAARASAPYVRPRLPTQPPAAQWIPLRARLWVSSWIYLKIEGETIFSRRRRTFALGQDSTQQPQTAMSRSANVEAFKGRERVVRTLPGPIASALALRNHPEGSSAPADRGGKLSKAIRSEGLCPDAQPKRAPVRASVREMVLAAPPPAPQELLRQTKHFSSKCIFDI